MITTEETEGALHLLKNSESGILHLVSEVPYVGSRWALGWLS